MAVRFGYDDRNDAHKLSNYKETRVIQHVDILPETTGMSMKDVAKLEKCLTNKTPFCLHNGERYIAFFPKERAIKNENEEAMHFPSDRAFMNCLKLSVFAYNKVFVESPKQKRLTNGKPR